MSAVKKFLLVGLLNAGILIYLAGCADSDADYSVLIDEEFSGSADGELSGPADDELSGSADDELSGPADDELSGSANGELSGSADGELSGPADAEFSRLYALPRYDAGYAPHYYDRPVNDFIPAPEYGPVYPYIGKKSVAGNWGWGEGEAVYLYGFTDLQGRVICDPVYTQVERITYGDRYVYAAACQYFEDGPYYDEQDNLLDEGYVAVIGADGSFCQKFDEVYLAPYQYDFEYEYIAVRKNNRWGAIGFDGAEILPCAYLNAPLFSESLAAVYQAGGEDPPLTPLPAGPDDDYPDSEMSAASYQADIPYVYVDANGEVILGPYQRPPRVSLTPESENGFDGDRHLETVAFRNERAMNFEGIKYGFIDKTGALAIPREYVPAHPLQNKWNEAGSVLACIADAEYTDFMDGYGFWTFSHNGITDEVVYALLDADGHRLCEYPGNVRTITDYPDGYYSLCNMDDELTAVFDCQGHALPVEGRYLSDNRWFYEIDPDSPEHTLIIRGHGLEHRLTAGSVIINHLTKDWFMITDPAQMTVHTFNARTNEELFWERRITSLYVRETIGERSITYATIRDINNGETTFDVLGVINNITMAVEIDFTFDRLTAIGDYYLAAQGNYGGLIDEHGDWVIKTPLFGNND